MTVGVIHHFARLERRHEGVGDADEEALGGDQAVEHAKGFDPVATQRGDKGHGLTVAIGHTGIGALAGAARARALNKKVFG